MNFLGHCFLCQRHTHLITGNLGGDFYKGKLSNFENLPIQIQQGIKHHRFIDDFTDKSKFISEAAHIFQINGIQKVSFIACDILLDHFLSENWNRYSSIPYNHFIEMIYAEVEQNQSEMTPDFRFLFNKMKTLGWFYDYPSHSGITKILRQFSGRMAFKNTLASSSEVYLNNKETIDRLFESFLNDIKHASDSFILDHKLGIS